MKKCIVNFASKNAWFPQGQKRLIESLKTHGFTGDILALNQDNLKCPSHSDIPYAFKLYALKEAQRRGYEVLLWVDASFWAIKPLNELFELIQKQKIILQSSDCFLGQWSSDASLEKLKIDRESVMKTLMFSGGLMGLDLRAPIAREFLNKFFEYAREGDCFKGSWTNRKQEVSKDSRVRGHRHDMVVGTVLAQRMNIKIQSNNSLFSYYGWFEQHKKEKSLEGRIFFLCEGGTRKI